MFQLKAFYYICTLVIQIKDCSFLKFLMLFHHTHTHNSLIFLILLLVSSSSIVAFRYAFVLFLKCLLASCLTLLRLCILLWLWSCTHHILASYLPSKKCKRSPSNPGLCCFNLHRSRLSLAEVLIFPLKFSQDLFMSSSIKFSKAANLFVISIW